MRLPRLLIAIAALLLAIASPALLAAPTPPKAAIASAHPAATAAGMAVLAAGGNAFDAAVAVSAALAVVEPFSSGLGGGGFWLLHVAPTQSTPGENIMIDGREMAPGAATRTMYQNEAGKVIPGLSLNGALAAGIPGEPAALAHIAKKYGSLPLSESLAPAIKLARDGFKVYPHMHDMIDWRSDVIAKHPASAKLLFTDDGKALPVGALFKQPDLSATLTALAEHGKAGFYQGEVAEKLVEGVQAAGGIWTLEDLANYKIVERQPITGKYTTPLGAFKIVSAAPPSSGGVVLVEALNILQGFKWADLSRVQQIHVAVEAMRRAYRDRAVYLGDPDFIDMPLQRLTSPFYAAGLRVGIRMDRATPSNMLASVTADYANGHDTTHFSIIDSHGNRVAATLSINYPFGSGVVPPGTGVFLNDEMDDFAAKPLVPNGYGLVSTEANAIAPYKRPLSSMTPTFVIGPDRTAALGTPGGSRIISMVLLATLTFTHGGDAKAMVYTARYHHQYLPDVIEYEPGAFDTATKEALKQLGHKLENVGRCYGDMHVVIWNKANNSMDAAADPRGTGAAAIGINKARAGTLATAD